MIRLGRMTDYAVVVLSRMAHAPTRRVSAAELAGDTGLSEATVAKIMKALAHAGLVGAQRGAGGGYALARTPADISIAEVVTALEGPIAITACVEGSSGHCAVEQLCSLRGQWDPVNQAIHDALAAVSLEQMAANKAPMHLSAAAE